ncbi:MAG: hypothetical protein K6B75_00835 [Lachnospiraceae bacterium]|nr:hypothetical protein [Lachnospiraceae bacterium]
MNDGTIVGLVGYECEDFTVYLAKILNYLSVKTIISDKTPGGSVFGILGIKPLGNGTAFYGTVPVCSRSPEEMKGFDVVLMCFGEGISNAEIGKCNKVVMFSDATAYRAENLEKVSKLGGGRKLFIRDYVPMKYGKRFISAVSGTSSAAVSLIYADERDIRAKCYLGTEKNVKLAGLSETMKNALKEVALDFFPALENRLVAEAIKKG